MVELPNTPRSLLIRDWCSLGALKTEGAEPIVGFDGRIEPYRLIVKREWVWLFERSPDGTVARWKIIGCWGKLTTSDYKEIMLKVKR